MVKCKYKQYRCHRHTRIKKGATSYWFMFIVSNGGIVDNISGASAEPFIRLDCLPICKCALRICTKVFQFGETREWIRLKLYFYFRNQIEIIYSFSLLVFEYSHSHSVTSKQVLYSSLYDEWAVFAIINTVCTVGEDLNLINYTLNSKLRVCIVY